MAEKEIKEVENKEKEAAKKVAPSLVKGTVLTPIYNDGKRYEVGETIEVTEEEMKALAGLVQEVK
ncbi:MAG: hypothetical protein HXM47_02950 [Pseudoleptotrichia goodfellowii]|nr:hypothetical protein [Pseudoleptotrichia goodfellowii]